jgi:hypothetical protein
MLHYSIIFLCIKYYSNPRNPMFTVYQKIISPESSPVLGPAKTSNDAPADPFSLCTCCCSDRHGKKSDMNDPIANANAEEIQTDEAANVNPIHHKDLLDPKTQEPKYPFGHATHYTYSITSPRTMCEFETGTPP